MGTGDPGATSGALFGIGFLLLIVGGILNFLIYGFSRLPHSVGPLAFLSGYYLWLIPIFAILMMILSYAVGSVQKSKYRTEA